MEAVIRKLADIEITAEKIVDHAAAQKTEIEKRIHQETIDFDKKLEAETQAKIDVVRTEAQRELSELVVREKERHKSIIENLEQTYEKHHEEYAKEILEKIIEG